MADWRDAARAGNIDRLYELIALDRNLLELIDEIPFEDTPLHVAAEAGCTHFAIEIMRLKPTFGRKLNPVGLSPLDLALRNGHTETVRRLIDIDSELIRVKGREGWTPLHYVAKIDEVDLLAEFLIACPPSINDLTIRKESTLHIAVANGSSRALKVLMGWLYRTNNQDAMHWKDEKGNTLLHIVASNNQLYPDNLTEVLKILSKEIPNPEENSDGLKALDIITGSQLSFEQKEAAKRILRGRVIYIPVHSFAEFLSSSERISERVLRFDINMKMGIPIEMVNALLVVAALLITVSYQAAVTPPTTELGDSNNMSPNLTTTANQNSTVSFANSLNEYHIYPGGTFAVLNAMTFALSTGIVICLLKLSSGGIPVHFSLIALNFCFWLLALERDAVPLNIVSSATFSINYAIFYMRIFMSSFEGNFPRRKSRLLANTISRLVMQQRTVASKYSWESGQQKRTNF